MSCARDIGSEEIIRILKSPEAVKVFEEQGALAAYLYGSAAQVDVHVAVAFKKSIEECERADRRTCVAGALKGLLQRDDVEVVCLDEDSPVLAFEVLKVPVVVFKANEHEVAEFEVKAMSMYYDWVEHCRVMSTLASGDEHEYR